MGERGVAITPKPNPRRANGHRRDQVIRRVKAEETHCWLCGLEVDKSLGLLPGVHSQRCRGEGCTGCVPHPMRAEIDEIVPVSLGGSAIDRTNCHLSHRRCNLRRGNGTKPKPIIKPVTTQRRWW